jgi:hypothetical protein
VTIGDVFLVALGALSWVGLVAAVLAIRARRTPS